MEEAQRYITRKHVLFVTDFSHLTCGQVLPMRRLTDFVVVAFEESAEFFWADCCLTGIDDILRQKRPEPRNCLIMFVSVEQNLAHSCLMLER